MPKEIDVSNKLLEKISDYLAEIETDIKEDMECAVESNSDTRVINSLNSDLIEARQVRRYIEDCAESDGYVVLNFIPFDGC